MPKPTVELRRFIQGNEDKERRPYPSLSQHGGGTVTYDLRIVGAIDGLTYQQTEIVINAVINATRWISIQGLQTAEVANEVRRLRRPYLDTLKAIAEPDEETLELLIY